MNMKIKDIKEHRIVPFEIEYEKIRKLFSFYLHEAPTIESKSSIYLDLNKLEQRWRAFVQAVPNIKIKIVSYSYKKDKIQKCIKDLGLSDDDPVNRTTNALFCKKKDTGKGIESETDCQCVLRHMRNSIAHGNVYLSDESNRKYILFEDYNRSGTLTARILLAQTHLRNLKQGIMK